MTVYFDCNATAPIEPRVWDAMRPYFEEEYGNAGSRTHEFGLRAKQAVQRARGQVAAVVKADAAEVIFTSGATESNNLAILGLANYALEVNRRHIITTAIEHKAVLEPVQQLKRQGFDVTLITPASNGIVNPSAVLDALRDDTLLVSIMQVNNETGVIQPIAEIAHGLDNHGTFFHVDAAQGFGKDIEPLRSTRIDLISVSSHKIYGPKGIGALVARSRKMRRPPLSALMYGGGQERGLRPGTLPVPLIVGLGVSAELAMNEHIARSKKCSIIRNKLLAALKPLDPIVNGAPEKTLPHVINVSFPGLNSEAVMLALKGVIAVSNGSACTSDSYELSHVLTAMGLPEDQIRGALRFSWCHLTEAPDYQAITSSIRALM